MAWRSGPKRKKGDIYERAWGGRQRSGGLPFSRAVQRPVSTTFVSRSKQSAH